MKTTPVTTTISLRFRRIRHGQALVPRGRSALLILALLGADLAGVARGQVVTEFPIPTASSRPGIIAAGPDGNLWFTEYSANQIGRITTAGAITEFPLPAGHFGPSGIAAGPDGNLWFTEETGNQISRITTAGVVTGFPIPTAASEPARYRGRRGRQPLVHRTPCEQDRSDHHGRRHHRVPHSHHRQHRWRHHGRPRRQPLVHIRWGHLVPRQDRPDHYGGPRNGVRDPHSP